MTEKRFTEEEVLKALYCCNAGICEECPVTKEVCFEIPLEVIAAHFIECQKEEIERLKKLLDDKCDRCIERDRVKVARDIFVDIKQNSQLHFRGAQNIVIMTESDFEAIKKKYTEDQP